MYKVQSKTVLQGTKVGKIKYSATLKRIFECVKSNVYRQKWQLSVVEAADSHLARIFCFPEPVLYPARGYSLLYSWQ